METNANAEALRQLPRIDDLLAHGALSDALGALPREAVVDVVEDVVAADVLVKRQHALHVSDKPRMHAARALEHGRTVRD